MSSRNNAANGLTFGLGATLLWGSYPLWYKPLAHLDAYHLLSWRIVWAQVFAMVLIACIARGEAIRATLRTTRPANVLMVSAVLGVWWLLYIHGVMTGRILEVAFGYFLSPIMSMAMSRLIFRERFSRRQIAAIGLALAGVILMFFQLMSLRSFPWIALVIGFCYAFYAAFKKKVPGDPVVVQGLELLALFPFAAGFLYMTHAQGAGHVFLLSPSSDLLLVATGLITVLPLWWFSRAAGQLSMVALGFLQFVPPTCNFLLAAFVYGEPVAPMKLAAFALIWAALALFTWDSIHKQRLVAQTLVDQTRPT